MPSSHNNRTTYREEFRPLSINPTSSPDVIIPYNISVSFHNDSKSKMGDKGRETIKLLHFECGLFPDWPVLTEGQITENRWNYTKEKISQ